MAQRTNPIMTVDRFMLWSPSSPDGWQLANEIRYAVLHRARFRSSPHHGRGLSAIRPSSLRPVEDRHPVDIHPAVIVRPAATPLSNLIRVRRINHEGFSGLDHLVDPVTAMKIANNLPGGEVEDACTSTKSIEDRPEAITGPAEPPTNSEPETFGVGERQDLAPVGNAITETWSNGQTEGQINRLKTLKRAMYGRAGVDLLRA
jgi:hypothetical protein